MKVALRTFGFLGVLLFGTAFWFTYGAPGFVEDAARDFIRHRIETEAREKIASIPLPDNGEMLGQIAGKLLRDHLGEISRLKAQLEAGVHHRLAGVIAEMRDLDCACREKYAQWIKEAIEIRVVSLQAANDSLMDFMKAAYMEVARKVTLDFRIFSGSNLAIFLLLLSASFLKPRAGAHLFLPVLLLFVSTLVCAYLYLFEQNWLFTILYNDYAGFGYFLYLLLLFGILCDIALNRARISTRVINGLLHVIGSAASVAPC